MSFLSADEVVSLADEVPAVYKALIYTLAYTGIRIGEASALRVRNIDLLRKRILVTEAASEVDGVRIVGDTKTRQKRQVAVPRFLAEILSEHLATFSTPADGDALVFRSEAGTPIGQHAFRRTFRRACARAGLSPAPRVHDLRHTAASLAIAAGAHPKLIQDMLGHSSVTTTMNVYGHLFDSLHEEVADRLDDAWVSAANHRQAIASVTDLPQATKSI